MTLAHLDPQVQIKLLDIAKEISIPDKYVMDDEVINLIVKHINMAYKGLAGGVKEES